MVSCNKCRGRAIIYQKYSGMRLCSAHFEEDVHRKIRESIRETGFFAHKARVAVALSGGKDSSTLLYALKTLFSKRRDIELIAIMIDEGIEGYRPKTLERARSLAERLEVPYVIKSVKEAAGMTNDEFASQKRGQTPCSFCVATRENLLNKTALELKADALAMGDNLDDEALAVLLNYLSGDIDGLFQLKHVRPSPGAVPRIKPLRRVPEKETALYAIEHRIYPSDPEICPYINAKDAMGREVKKMLNDFEARHPGTKYSLLRSLDRLLGLPPNLTIQGKSL
jgi:uncharacterized protein (TIGR00269 family)